VANVEVGPALKLWRFAPVADSSAASAQRREREGGDVEEGAVKRAAADHGEPTPLMLLERDVEEERSRLAAVLQSARDAEAAFKQEQQQESAPKPLSLPSRVLLDVGGTK
jgi:hypothetical protein